MNRRRTNSRTLTGTRIFARSGKYYYFAPEPMLNPKTGKVATWHILCPIEDGELKAREALLALLGAAEHKGKGDFCAWFDKWRTAISKKREDDAPKDPARKAIWDRGTKDLLSVFGVIENAFAEFDLVQIDPAACWEFLEPWDGRRSGQSYRGHLSKFFEWCCKRGLMSINPVLHISMTPPKRHDVYFTDEQYKAIHEALGQSDDKHNGRMTQGYMDLLYLFYQRGTDVRLLRKDQISADGILFKPTKTERSSGAKVLVPVSEEAQKVIDWLKSITDARSIYLFHDRNGQPFTAQDAGKEFRKACRKAKISGVTLKDIRAKAATDAKRQGYSMEQIKDGLAHMDEATTKGYVRSREVPVSQIVLKLPK